MRQKLLLLFCFGLFLFGNTAFAQEKLVTGIVRDANGEPIQAASVKIMGTTKGTITDDRGAFKIGATSESVLQVSAINYKNALVKVGDQSSIEVVLEPGSESELSDVVVTALGIERNRNTLPYSAQQVQGTELSKTGTLNPVSALSGKVAGLQITQSNTMGGSANVILRGVKSLTQSNQALFVVDGVPYDNSSPGVNLDPNLNANMTNFDLGNAAADLNSDDIESVTVLKGAAASALYGSRAANGVVMITTKKGTKDPGLGVTASFGLTVGSLDNSTLPEYQTEYGQGLGSAGFNEDFPNQDGFFNYIPIFNSQGKRVNVVQTNNDAALGPAYDPNLMVYNWDAFTPGNPNYGKATPWVAAKNNRPQDFFVTPITTSTSVSVSNSNEKGSFLLGFRHDDNKDFMPNSKYKKNSLDFKATYNLLDNLSVGASINYSNNSAKNRYLFPYTAGTNPMTDFRQWWPTNVDLNQQKDDYFHSTPGQVTNATWNWQNSAYMNNTVENGVGLPAYHDNPYWYAYTNYESDSRDRFFGNVHIDYQISPYIKATARVSKDYYQQIFETRSDIGSQTTPSYTRYNGAFDETNYDLLLTFNKDLSKDVNLTALLGGNVRQTVDQNIFNQTDGGLVVPGFFALSNSVKTPPAPSEFYGKREVDGVYAQATIGYKEMVTLDGTIRRDQSSTLPKENNAYYYPSVSLNFQFGKLLPNMTWLSHGKVWGNYAEVGNDAPLFSLNNTYTAQTPFNGQSVFQIPATNNNPDLLPERNKSIEVGLEASFLNDRLGFSIDYYHTKQVDQIMPTSVSQSTGFSSFFVNGGTIQNSGIELSVNLVPVRTRNFSWNMDVNWSNNKQKVISLYNDQPSYVVSSYQNSIRLVAIPGMSYQLQGTDYVYKDGQRVIDEDGYYEIAENEYSNLGSPFPVWRGGVNNNFRYKNFSLSFLVDMSHGGSIYSLDMDYGSGSGLYPRTAGTNDLGNPVRSPLTNDSKSGGIILPGVTEDGKPNTVRIDESDANANKWSFSSAYGEADREFVYDASYIKLREVNFTYSLPKTVFKKANYIKGVDISLSGKNLWIIHKNLPYADPEQGQASGNASMGFQNGAYPTVRNIGFNVRINF